MPDIIGNRVFVTVFALVFSIGIISFLPFSYSEGLVCPSGETEVIRVTNPDPVCINQETAIRWNDLGIAKMIVAEKFAQEENLPEKDQSIVIVLKPTTEFNPLPSWNEGDSKQKIIFFVNSVTDPDSPFFVPSEDRIATFDNDGTLWIERPLYIPFAFHLEYLYEQLENDPDLSSQSPYKEILEKKDSISNEDLDEISGLSEILITAFPGNTQEEYLQKSKNFLGNTKHPKYGVAFKELTYLPMVELVHYLQQNDFEVYIVSAGFQGLMRSVSEEIYNIEEKNVIGTHPEFVFKLTEQGPVLIRQSSIASFNDGPEKPVNIQKLIGKKPIFACGNSGGDIEMLLLTQYHQNHFGCMVDHDDEQREYFYLNSEALETAEKNEWLIISMKNDFKTIFEPFSKNPTQNKITLECSPEFWESNLDLWDIIGVDYNQDFDETFGRNYFDSNITLEEAIKKQGVGMDHLARSGTAAYLNAMADPEFDEETVRTAVNFGYVHQLDKYLSNCKDIQKIIP